MTAWSGSVLPEFLQDDMARELRGLLASRGQLRPSITVAVDTPNPDVVRASVTVDGGPITRVRRLVFEGTAAIGEPESAGGVGGRASISMRPGWTRRRSSTR